jgi:hypothetical protein
LRSHTLRQAAASTVENRTDRQPLQCLRQQHKVGYEGAAHAVERSGNVRIVGKPEVGTWTKSRHLIQLETMNYVTSTSMDSRFCVRVNTSGCRYSGAIVHRLRQASGFELRSSKERGIALWTEFAKDILGIPQCCLHGKWNRLWEATKWRRIINRQPTLTPVSGRSYDASKSET